ncbi:MAG: DUF2163 domain-containing protein [Rhodobacteraceae bacterium]|nr:DUF2163 domain-containing protein [Paracoccaceae bacterium]
MAVPAGLQAQLDSGATTLCQCWELRRKDGAAFGFTDHDRNLSFSGLTFKADTGLTGQALQQTTGLSVNNAEVIGALSDISVSEADLVAGRFDGAEVRAWLVDWSNVSDRALIFRGTLGEIVSGGGEFRVELRGLSEELNRSQGRVYHHLCGANLGDSACKVDLSASQFSTQATVASVEGQQEFTLSGAAGFAERHFERGRIEVVTGAASGLSGFVKRDELEGSFRRLTLWQELRAPVTVGDKVRIEAGCDKRLVTCRAKFGNSYNFRGFPHIPGEDWMMAYPKQSGRNDGGSRN